MNVTPARSRTIGRPESAIASCSPAANVEAFEASISPDTDTQIPSRLFRSVTSRSDPTPSSILKSSPPRRPSPCAGLEQTHEPFPLVPMCPRYWSTPSVAPWADHRPEDPDAPNRTSRSCQLSSESGSVPWSWTLTAAARSAHRDEQCAGPRRARRPHRGNVIVAVGALDQDQYVS